MKIRRLKSGSNRRRVGLGKNNTTVLDHSAKRIDRLTDPFEFRGLAGQLGVLDDVKLPAMEAIVWETTPAKGVR